MAFLDGLLEPPGPNPAVPRGPWALRVSNPDLCLVGALALVRLERSRTLTCASVGALASPVRLFRPCFDLTGRRNR